MRKECTTKELTRVLAWWPKQGQREILYSTEGMRLTKDTPKKHPWKYMNGNQQKQKWALLSDSSLLARTFSQHQYMPVPSAVAKSGSAGCLGISWPRVISGWFMWQRKARLSHLHFTLWKFPFHLITLPVLAFGSFSSPVGFVKQQRTAHIWPQQSGQAVFDWDKVHLTWQVYPALKGSGMRALSNYSQPRHWGRGALAKGRERLLF